MSSRSLILASSSRFRKALLERLMIPFEVIAPSIDETPKDGESPADLVARLSVEKARVVADSRPHSLVIGSDQIAVHQDKIVGKPHDHTHAQAQLRAASGETITLLTGLALIDSDSGRVQVDVVSYTVKFRRLSDAQIDRYLKKERPYQCSGSLRADGLGVALLERFEGTDPNALVGLPLIRLVDMLRTEGWEIL
jgi:septum formation protein